MHFVRDAWPAAFNFIPAPPPKSCSAYGNWWVNWRGGGKLRFGKCTSAVAMMGEGCGHIVVCGGGVIGACVAFYLGKLGVRVTVVEKTGIACAASGKAGGFLALDWCDGSPVGSLARASFKLHQELAEELGGSDYGYRRVETLSVGVDENLERTITTLKSNAAGWIDGPARAMKPMGSTKTTAQVHPELFTRKVMSVAMDKYGVSLVTGEAKDVSVEVTDGNVARVRGVWVDGEMLPADSVVLAMGPWSANNKLISSLAKVSPLKAHSIVLRPRAEDAITPHMLFLSYKTREGRNMDPEIYPRPNGEVYVCGMSEDVELPESAEQVTPKRESIAMLLRVAATVSSHFTVANAEVTAEQACLLPCSEDGIPLIGRIPNVGNVYVATGHSCWGILNAPATGASLAELIVGGVSKTVDLTPFNPGRFLKTSWVRR